MMTIDKKNIEKEFVERTLKNYNRLKHYPDIYEITLLINSTVGLLFIPKEKINNKLCNDLLDKELLTQLQGYIVVNTYNQKGKNESFNQVIRHIRNAIAHGKFKFLSNEYSNISKIDSITHIKFTDVDVNDKNKKFIITLSIDLFEELMIQIANYIVNK